ncbi:hypothetical protein WJX73_006396 [Symbiochloris irregularis]|uniref:L domain-like protein n=1 Tax=Symbiochloris irregularis TaxID=706552 RepID=A0AAW1P1Q6_9CHLO
MVLLLHCPGQLLQRTCQSAHAQSLFRPQKAGGSQHARRNLQCRAAAATEEAMSSEAYTSALKTLEKGLRSMDDLVPEHAVRTNPDFEEPIATLKKLHEQSDLQLANSLDLLNGWFDTGLNTTNFLTDEGFSELGTLTFQQFGPKDLKIQIQPGYWLEQGQRRSDTYTVFIVFKITEGEHAGVRGISLPNGTGLKGRARALLITRPAGRPKRAPSSPISHQVLRSSAFVESTASAPSTSPSNGTLLLAHTSVLAPRAGDVLGIIVPQSLGTVNVDIQLAQLNTTNISVVVYCNPGYSSYLAQGPPQPGNAIWSSNLSSSGFNISANDPNFPHNNSQSAYIVCSVINGDDAITTQYQLNATAVPTDQTLNNVQQQALLSIYRSCCGGSGTCTFWKEQNFSGATNVNFCDFPGQTCSSEGTLTQLNMTGWNLSCAFPSADIASFTSLTSLDLSYNPSLTGNLSDAWQALAALGSLEILRLVNDTGLQGVLASTSVTQGSICDLTALVSVDLSGMQLTGSWPQCLLSSTNIISLSLGNNQLTGTIPNAVLPNSALQLLAAFNNKLTGSIPFSLGNATQLVNLDLSQNRLTGTISPSLAGAPDLMNLILMSNQLEGSLPSAVLTGINIRTVDVKANKLTVLPDNWGSGQGIPVNSTLVNLRISFNNFQGSFPISLIKLPNLMFLIMNNNSLSGTLPDMNGMFPALRAFNVSNNQFNGTIPTQFQQTGIFTLAPVVVGNQQLTQVFDLSHNRLTGSVPGFLDFNLLERSVASGVYLAGNNLTNTCAEQLSYIPNLCSSTSGGASSGSAGAPPPPASDIRGAGTTESTSGSSGLSGGAIAGIVIGALIGVCVAILAGILFLTCRGRRKSANRSLGEPGRRSSLQSNLKTVPSARSTGGFGNDGTDFNEPNFANGNALPTRGSNASSGSKPGLGSKLSGISLPGKLSSLGSNLGGRQSGFDKFEDEPAHR